MYSVRYGDIRSVRGCRLGQLWTWNKYSSNYTYRPAATDKSFQHLHNGIDWGNKCFSPNGIINFMLTWFAGASCLDCIVCEQFLPTSKLIFLFFLAIHLKSGLHISRGACCSGLIASWLCKFRFAIALALLGNLFMRHVKIRCCSLPKELYGTCNSG